ncbi:MAG: glycosyltransferase [Firmicutes bacterium]|nr:glycosyltransferase [Bacillota bacterium]
MNIALFTDTAMPVVDGVGRVVQAYAEHMNAKGHKCFVAAPDPIVKIDDSAHPFEIARFAGIRLSETPYKVGLPFVDIGFTRDIGQRPIDIVHVHSPFSAGQAGLQAARRHRVPLVATFHSKYYDDFYRFTHMKVASKIGVKVIVDFYKKCDEVWAVSAATAETLKEYGYPGEVVVMENGTNPKLRDDQAVEEVRAKYALGDGPVIFFAGQMDWKKNLLHLLNTCAALRDMGANFKLVIAGQGKDEAAIKAKAAELNLADRTVFCGHISNQRELDAMYFCSDVFFFPSYYDNAPMVVREAAATGLPSVLAEGSSSAEVIEDGINGLLCGKDAQEDAKMIKDALARPGYLKQLGAAARETIPHSWDHLVDQALDRYVFLIENYQGKKRRRRETVSSGRQSV